jgi:hypothetical protein
LLNKINFEFNIYILALISYFNINLIISDLGINFRFRHRFWMSEMFQISVSEFQISDFGFLPNQFRGHPYTCLNTLYTNRNYLLLKVVIIVNLLL